MAALGLVSVLAFRALSDATLSTDELSHASRAQHFQQDADMYHDGLRAYVYAAALAGDYAGIDARTVLADLATDSETFRADLEVLAEPRVVAAGEAVSLAHSAGRRSVHREVQRDRAAHSARPAGGPGTARGARPLFHRAQGRDGSSRRS